MTETEKLRFQSNIENIKKHVRNSLRGEEIIFTDFGPYCTGCGSESLQEKHLIHSDTCVYVEQQLSKKLLREWVS